MARDGAAVTAPAPARGAPTVAAIVLNWNGCDDTLAAVDSLLAQVEAALEFAGSRGGDQVVSFGETQLRGSAGDGQARAAEPAPRRRSTDRQDGEAP